MSDKILQRFGKYLLLDHMVDGGMAKICRARYLGEQADKIVAIKMVQPQYSQDESFKTMFMDEIKVTFGLLHPNIVQTYDYGYSNGQLYVAMEYCDGRNLKEYLDKLKERKFVFPVEISVYIITQVCQGLHYAHTLTDKLTGKAYNIIHRDISPHNLMLTFDGAIKVIDFGIAKADTNSEATQAGTIKGKLSYLAPEYLEGKALDERYDQFAVGITLWEMLCSRKLFKAANDLAVLKKIQECKIPPPSIINPNVPKELDEIVLKSLQRDRNKRYENMDQMNRALIKFLYSTYPDFNATDLSYFAKELFKEEIKKDREKLFEFGKINLAPYLEDIKRESQGGRSSDQTSTGLYIEHEGGSAAGASSEPDRNPDSTSTNNRVLDFGFDGDGEESQFTKSGTRIIDRKKLMGKGEARSQRKTKRASAGGDGTLQLGNAGKRKNRSQLGADSGTTRASSTRIMKAPGAGTKSSFTKKTQLTRKKSNAKVQIALGIIAAIGVYSYLTVFKKGDVDDTAVADNKIEKQQTTDRNPSSTGGGAVADASTANTGKLIISNYNKYKQKAYIDGKVVEVDILGDVKNVPYGQHILRVQSSGTKHFVHRFSLSESRKSEKVTIPEMGFAVFGYLTTPYTCAIGNLSFSLYGEDRVEKVPFEGKRGVAFPLDFDADGASVPTAHTVYFQKSGEDFQRKIKFELKYENDSKDFCQVILEQ